MDRELWEPPTGPPRRPPGIPDFGPNAPTFGWRSYKWGDDHPLVWAWVDGAWDDRWVTAESQDRHGWWRFLNYKFSRSLWVHESRTAPRGFSPAELAEFEEWRARNPAEDGGAPG